MKKVAVIMGSDSDLPVVKNAIVELKKFGVEYEVHVMSAHRTPVEACEFSANAEKNGFGVIICAAGMAAHLAGVVAGHTILPVIAVPMKSSVLDGMDALMSIVQMPSGIPVATVAINGSKNAAHLALQIMANQEPALRERLLEDRREMENSAMKANEEVMAKYC